MKKIAKFRKNEFIKRFIGEVLTTRKNVEWEKKLNITPSVIPGRWRKGALPNLNHVAKICEIDSISADWLLFGIGNKNLSENKAYSNLDKMDDIYEKILQKDFEIKKLKKENKKLLKIIMDAIEIYVSSSDSAKHKLRSLLDTNDE